MKDGEKLANPPMGCKIACYREEPGAGKPHAGICEGGVGQPASLPRLSNGIETMDIAFFNGSQYCVVHELRGGKNHESKYRMAAVNVFYNFNCMPILCE